MRRHAGWKVRKGPGERKEEIVTECDWCWRRKGEAGKGRGQSRNVAISPLPILLFILSFLHRYRIFCFLLIMNTDKSALPLLLFYTEIRFFRAVLFNASQCFQNNLFSCKPNSPAGKYHLAQSFSNHLMWRTFFPNMPGTRAISEP